MSIASPRPVPWAIGLTELRPFFEGVDMLCEARFAVTGPAGARARLGVRLDPIPEGESLGKFPSRHLFDDQPFDLDQEQPIAVSVVVSLGTSPTDFEAVVVDTTTDEVAASSGVVLPEFPDLPGPASPGADEPF